MLVTITGSLRLDTRKPDYLPPARKKSPALGWSFTESVQLYIGESFHGKWEWFHRGEMFVCIKVTPKKHYLQHHLFSSFMVFLRKRIESGYYIHVGSSKIEYIFISLNWQMALC